MLRSEASVEAAVFPRVIEMVMGIVAAGVSHPPAITIDMRCIWVSGLVVEMMSLIRLRPIGLPPVLILTLRPMRRDIATADMNSSTMLAIVVVLRKSDRAN